MLLRYPGRTVAQQNGNAFQGDAAQKQFHRESVTESMGVAAFTPAYETAYEVSPVVLAAPSFADSPVQKKYCALSERTASKAFTTKSGSGQ